MYPSRNSLPSFNPSSMVEFEFALVRYSVSVNKRDKLQAAICEENEIMGSEMRKVDLRLLKLLCFLVYR